MSAQDELVLGRMGDLNELNELVEGLKPYTHPSSPVSAEVTE